MKRKERKPVEKGTWMNTYSDMVTLLMCFFVLLFSMSTIDAAKWEILVKSLNPKATKVSQIVDQKSEGENDVSSKGENMLSEIEEFDQLAEQMQDYVEQNNLQEDIEISEGEDFIFVTFRNNIFFDPDSYILKDQGKVILDAFSNGIMKIVDEIGEIRVLGHTNQADPNRRNSVEGDRFLSSDRATEVLVYIENKNFIDSKKLVSIGYGQNWPIASFITDEDRAKNRRVEILITKTQAANISLEEVYKTVGKSEPELNQ